MLVLSFGFFLFDGGTARAQQVDSTRQAQRADSLRSQPPVAPPDSMATGPRAPARPRESQLKEPVTFSARDSLVLHFGRAGGDRGALFGEAEVHYGEATLSAYRVDILFDEDELHAHGLPSDTGMVGRPSFAQGSDTFQGESLAFNLRTERGRVVQAQTAIQEGFVRAGVVKIDEDSTLYIRNGIYTTCSCTTDPSYSLRSNKMKIVHQKWIYTGPIQLYIFNIATPLWLPFGFLPAQEGRRSGPLPPRYGEDDRGFYLRDWGWYSAISPYMDLQVRLGLWTSGSFEIAPLYRYARRYHYNGSLAIDYVRNRRGERDDPDFQVFTTSSLRWNHSQDVTPTANLVANVNLSSQNYLRTVSEQYNDRVRQQIQSSIRFSKTWKKRRLALNLNHNELLATGQTNLTLPQLSYTQNASNPFKRAARLPGQDERWYEKIQYTYRAALENTFTFQPLPDDTLAARGDAEAAGISWYEALLSPSKYRRATGQDVPFAFKTSHNVGLSAPFTLTHLPALGRFMLNVSPSASYTENWFLRTNREHLDEDNTVEIDRQAGFFALRQFNVGASANTTFYGTFPLHVGPFSGLRHTVRPTLGFSYQPDFYDPTWGYTRERVDAAGNTVRYPIVKGVSQGLRQSLSFSVNNVFETKRARTDSTGQDRSRTIQLLYLDVSTSYNFAADSLELAPVTLSARSSALGPLDVRLSSTFSPYAFDPATGRTLGRYVFDDAGFQLARLTRLDFSVSGSFRSRRSAGGRPSTAARAQPFSSTTGATPTTSGEEAFGGTEPFNTPYSNTSLGYADFAIPWSLQLNANYSLSRPAAKAIRRATFNTSFDFSVTPNWKVQGRSGYDLIQHEITLTDVSILRDFDCWQMSFRWVPFGQYQSYSFDLHVKSGHLRDLLRIRQPRSDVRGRFGNLINR